MINDIGEDDWWRENVCFSRRKFFDLVDLLKTTIELNPNTFNFRSLSAIILYYLKDTGSLDMTANHFGVANCKASKVIFEVSSTTETYNQVHTFLVTRRK